MSYTDIYGYNLFNNLVTTKITSIEISHLVCKYLIKISKRTHVFGWAIRLQILTVTVQVHFQDSVCTTSTYIPSP